MSSEAVKALRIAAGSLKRTTKELLAYRAEKETNEVKIRGMKEAGADVHDIRQQQNVLNETLMMLPDCTKRLQGTLEHTHEAVDTYGGEVGDDCEQLAAAKAAIEAAQEALGDEAE